MEEKNEEVSPREEYKPRPGWQVWGARLLLVMFLILIAMYYVNIASGGR